MTGRGGWPLNAFLTPELVPFYAGTYFPPESAMGRPGFRQVLLAVAEFYRNHRPQAHAYAGELLARARPGESVLIEERVLGVREQFGRHLSEPVEVAVEDGTRQTCPRHDIADGQGCKRLVEQ